MLVINPEECIDCGVCEPECPIEAIKPESAELIDFIEIAAQYSKIWPGITKIKPALPEAELHKDELNKFEKYIRNNSETGAK